MADMKFSKAVATGNDFIIVDNRSGSLAIQEARDRREGAMRQAVRLAVTAYWSLSAQRWRISACGYSIRRSEAEMCGNGSRCLRSTRL